MTKVEKAMDVLKKAFRDDPDYADSWHCNIAMAFYDASGPVETASKEHAEQLKTANDGAARFMKLALRENDARGVSCRPIPIPKFTLSLSLSASS